MNEVFGIFCLDMVVGSGRVVLKDVPISSESQRQELLDGPVRGIELYTSGYLVLHGSCLDIRGNLVSIVGSAGAGKSTLAAVLCERGAKLVSDGMTPVHPETLGVAPGAARTKLDDESLRLLGQDCEQFSLVHPESLKRYYPVPGIDTTEQSQRALRLCAIFVVEDAAETSIEAFPAAESLIKLIANVYLASYLPPDHSPILMQRAASLIQHGVQVKALRRAKEAGRLLEIIEAIEREATAVSK